jgi:hypothetical protein
MSLPTDILKQIVSINLKNPTVIRYMELHHIAMAELKQKLIQELHTKNIRNRYHYIFDDIKKSGETKPLSASLLTQLHHQGYLDIIIDYLNNDYIKNIFYIVSHLGYIEENENVYTVYAVKKGKNHAYIVIYKLNHPQELFIQMENRRLAGIFPVIYK